jgi:hypothetical protein
MQYYTTRAFPTASRQYEAGDAIDPANITTAEWIRGTESGAVVPARWYGTAAELASRGVPGPGIQVYETDTTISRVGDGVASVASLPQAGSGTYVPMLGPSNGSDDSAWFNARISTGGTWRGNPGETYRLPDGLVLRSNTTLDFTGCTLDATASFVVGKNWIRNWAAFNPTSHVTDGAISAGSNIVTSSAVAVVGQTVVVKAAGGKTADASGPGAWVPLVATVTSVGSGTLTLDKSATLTVTGMDVWVYDRDQNIKIIGGAWNRGSVSAGNGGDAHCFFLRRVDGLDVQIESFTGTAGNFAISAADVTSYILGIGKINHVRDGIHIMGPATNGRVLGISGTTGDDSVSITASDYTGSTADTSGDVSGLLIDRIDTVSAHSQLKLIAGVENTLSGIRVGIVSGQSDTSPVWIGADEGGAEAAGTTGGYYDGIDFGTVLAKTTDPANNGIVGIYTTNGGTIQGRVVACGTASYSPDAIRLQPPVGSATGALDSLDVEFDVSGPGRLLYVTNVNQRIRKMVARGSYTQNGPGTSTTYGIRVDSGTIELLETPLVAGVDGGSYLVGVTDAAGVVTFLRNQTQTVSATSLVSVTGTGAWPAVASDYRHGTLEWPMTVDIGQIKSGDNAGMNGANGAVYQRVTQGGRIIKIGLHVITSSGNISVGVFRNGNGLGRSARPGAMAGTSGAIACPSAGYTEIALTTPVEVMPGDWLAISADNTTAKFYSVGTGTADTNLAYGRQCRTGSNHPLPSTAGTPVWCIGYNIALVGIGG